MSHNLDIFPSSPTHVSHLVIFIIHEILDFSSELGFYMEITNKNLNFSWSMHEPGVDLCTGTPLT
ncbi:predicted protein [Sclerotinia sclerotiorum 1980 UF-70]|uniref:Uncharacterized protein n=1 Tax=Sclerotinia sclerotiorum (strain ATCC 18683 / 1980 / Ss-1) TaxID=665079 RepID=A7EDH8_SCLS1|nr:predicted protein [Sclerotinia sclerotiorum 1980 UF-70]EDO00894.1 predicted protein [Sclerotinia sclerotiorum 1980 UF-70]